MKDQTKTKKQLTLELTELKQRISEFESGEPERRRTEESLRESEERFRAIADYTYDWENWVGSDGKLIWINSAVLPFTGYSVDECLGMADFPLSLINGADLEKMAKHFAAALQGSRDNDVEFQIRCKDGSTKWATVSYQPLYDSTGVNLGYRSSVRDITERKRAEEALRQSERELATIFDGSPILMLVVDRNYRVRKLNRTMQAALGVIEADLKDVPCGDLLRCLNRLDSPEGCCHGPKCEACALRQAVQRTLETTVGVSGVEAVFETETKGQPCRSSFSLSTNLLEMDGEAMVLVCMEDITQRKRTEEALKETNQNLQALIQASPLAIVAVDAHKNILKWNPAAERIFGWSEKEVLGRPTPIIPEEKEEEFRDIFENVFRGNTISGLETCRRKKDGTLIDVSLSTAPLYGENVQIQGSIAILEDIAERKKTEEERQKLFEQLRTGRERLQELSRRLVEVQETERRDLARELHDEVGQNLTALSINLNIIQTLISDESASKATDRINDSQRLVEETVVCIRDVTARLRPPVLDDYGLAAALNWYSRQFIKRTGIPTALILKGEESAHRLPLGTETAMFRIAQEALNNVAKHAKANQVTLILEKRGKSIRLIIADNGMGFDPIAHHQFGEQPEWGLISMRERAHSIGGQFQIETTQGKGTKVIVEVPKRTDT